MDSLVNVGLVVSYYTGVCKRGVGSLWLSNSFELQDDLCFLCHRS